MLIVQTQEPDWKQFRWKIYEILTYFKMNIKLKFPLKGRIRIHFFYTDPQIWILYQSYLDPKNCNQVIFSCLAISRTSAIDPRSASTVWTRREAESAWTFSDTAWSLAGFRPCIIKTSVTAANWKYILSTIFNICLFKKQHRDAGWALKQGKSDQIL